MFIKWIFMYFMIALVCEGVNVARRIYHQRLRYEIDQ